MPKINLPPWSEKAPGPNPLTGQDDGPYAEIVLGDVVGITQFGARLERLPPGSRSSHRHWHETEDELVYVLAGELVLVEDEETVLLAGDVAGWKAGVPVAHCLENRSEADAVLLVVGTRSDHGVVHYPDHDVILRHDADGKTFTRSDGTPIER